jgi:hypothetical protein
MNQANKIGISRTQNITKEGARSTPSSQSMYTLKPSKQNWNQPNTKHHQRRGTQHGIIAVNVCVIAKELWCHQDHLGGQTMTLIFELQCTNRSK